MIRKRFYESVDSAYEILKKALTIMLDEWALVARNFTLIDDDEIAVAVNLINNDIDVLRQADAEEIADKLDSDSDLKVIDDIYVDNESIVADCYILNSKLSPEERTALTYIKGDVSVTAVRENGRDIIRVKIKM